VAEVKLLPILGALGVILTFVWYLNTYPIPGLSSSLGPYFTDLIAPLLFTFMGIITAGEVRHGPALAGCFTLIGVGLAMILNYAYVGGMITAAMIAPATLEQYQAIVVVASLLIGGAVGLSGGRS
jgi:uncharacterized membrane protein